MQTTRSTKLVLSALILACLVLSVVPGTSDAHRYLWMGWPDEPEDPDFIQNPSVLQQEEPGNRGTQLPSDELETEV